MFESFHWKYEYCKFGLFSLLQLLVSSITFFLEITILRYAFSEKQKYTENFNSIRIIAL